MRTKTAALLLAVTLLATAQTRFSVQQLVEFIRSSIQLKHEDRDVARFLRGVKMAQRLDDRTVEQLQGEGAGPRTVEALRELRDASQSLPAPPPPEPKTEPAPMPPPSPGEQQRVLKEARDYALSYTKQLPDFMCTQVTRRYIDPTGLEFWREDDVITARLTYFEQREEYRVLMANNRPVDMSYESLGGAVSTGEFGSMLKEIFEPATETRFRWERWGKLRGSLVHVFSYQVAQPRSHWRVSYQRTVETTPGYRGLIYVERDTQTVVRVTLEALLPPDFPLQQVSTVLDYDFAEIAGGKYMLPLKAVMRMRDGRLLAKNDVEFRLYRKFAAEATVTYEEPPPPLPAEKTTEQPPTP
jgi:hypothetical protein